MQTIDDKLKKWKRARRKAMRIGRYRVYTREGSAAWWLGILGIGAGFLAYLRWLYITIYIISLGGI